MANYFEIETIKELNEYRKKIFDIRQQAFDQLGIDILDNDTLSALSQFEIVNSYDPDYNINFARNGEDAISKETVIEQKCSRVKKYKRKEGYPDAVFMFHAKGDLEYPRYIFSARDHETLEIFRIYDISDAENVAAIVAHLKAESDAWSANGFQKRDVITVPESLLRTLKITKTETKKGCEIVWA
jgi:hypothetical protein